MLPTLRFFDIPQFLGIHPFRALPLQLHVCGCFRVPFASYDAGRSGLPNEFEKNAVHAGQSLGWIRGFKGNEQGIHCTSIVL